MSPLFLGQSLGTWLARIKKAVLRILFACRAGYQMMKLAVENMGSNTERMISVEATDALNRLKGQVTLFACEAICPRVSPVETNMYYDNHWLFC